jgi:hypothetical protein
MAAQSGSPPRGSPTESEVEVEGKEKDWVAVKVREVAEKKREE